MLDSQLDFQVNRQIHGFQVKANTKLPALNMIALQLQHIKTGARILHLYTSDAENLFSISFPTPPQDDTGVPHILEHSVLAGSRKYPVREPFFEMVKMSMATFINAMTGWDCTFYPVASNVKQDLFNLADVYFDAVFFPLLTEITFQREAHHLAPLVSANPTGELTINGIVYNEMKGLFSDPEARLSRLINRGLFPDTLYGNESGGDPDHIPELTYDQLKRFHQMYYHPSNSYFLFYGNIPTVEYLQFLNDKLNAFDRQVIPPMIMYQPRWHQPRLITECYPIGKNEPTNEKTYLTISWLVGYGTDAIDVASWYILSKILLGNEAAPLKKAIIDSRLGQDLIYSGFQTVGLETTFRVGLKGSEPDRCDAFIKLVLETLTHIAEQKMDRDRIEAAFQQAAYHYREILPDYPLHLMDRVLEAWLYGADPLTFVRMNDHLEACKRLVRDDPRFFNKLIKKRLLQNRHRLTLILKPDIEWEERTAAAFNQKMNQVRQQFNVDQLQQIAAKAREIERTSGEPNSAEALATLPQLKVSDLPPKPQHIPTTVEKLDGIVSFLHNDVFTNGVNYLYLNFDLKGLPTHLWQFLPHYADAIRKLGAAGMNYQQIANRVAAYTDGIHCWYSFTTHSVDPNQSVWGLRFSLKTLDEQLEPALQLLHDLIFSVDPRDRDRLRDVVVQAAAHYRTDLVHDGADTASRHASRGFTPEGYLYEMINGLPQLSLTERMNQQFDTMHPELMDNIEAIRDFIVVPERMTVSFTGSDRAGLIVRRELLNWINHMPRHKADYGSPAFTPYEHPPREGLAGPMQVAFCAQIFPAPHASHAEASLLKLGTRIISLDYILNEIRFKGNAYGAWCKYDSLARELELGSYRDPHIVRTLNTFAKVLDYVRKAAWTQADIDRAIIGTAKHYLEPIRPREATDNALHRHLTGTTPEIREQRYEQIRAATVKDVKRATMDLFDSNLKHSAICVVSSRQKLEDANRHMPDQPLAIEDILNSAR